ncbi:hypothetical protein L3Y34_010160 [Caenorhabditis briggsae]|uniref:Uncharacterized protein n=1 Tax=Caenorhabditis briggsae TaxID=6238 RepID=A0AAE8ZNJ1_CAEBR|nr:hypothetical protein L3Y34_010160 [Caenorhabditis briggsae]
MSLSKLIIKKHPLRQNGHLSSTSEQSIAELFVKNYQNVNSVLLRDIIEVYIQTDTKLTASFFREMSRFKIVDVTEAIEEKTLSLKKHGNGRLIFLDGRIMTVDEKNISPKIGFFAVDGDTCTQYIVEDSKKNRIIKYQVATGIPSVDRYEDQESLTTSQFWVRSEDGTSEVVDEFHLELQYPECMFSKSAMIKHLISLIVEDFKPDQLNQLICTMNEDKLRELSKSVITEIEVSPNKASDHSRKIKVDKEGKLFYGKRDGSEACKVFPYGDCAVYAEIVLSSLDSDTGLTECLITDTSNNCRFSWKSNYSVEIEGFSSVRMTFQVKAGIVSTLNIYDGRKLALTDVPSAGSARLEPPFTFDADSDHHEQLRFDDESGRTPDPNMSQLSASSPKDETQSENNSPIQSDQEEFPDDYVHEEEVVGTDGICAGPVPPFSLKDILDKSLQNSSENSLDQEFHAAQMLLMNSPERREDENPPVQVAGQDQSPKVQVSKRPATEDYRKQPPLVKRQKTSELDNTTDAEEVGDDVGDEEFVSEEVDISLKELKKVECRGRLMRDYEYTKLVEMKRIRLLDLFKQNKSTMPVVFTSDSTMERFVLIEGNHRTTVLKWTKEEEVPDGVVRVRLVYIVDLFNQLWDLAKGLPSDFQSLKDEEEYELPRIDPRLTKYVLKYHADTTILQMSKFTELDETLFLCSAMETITPKKDRIKMKQDAAMRNRHYDMLVSQGLLKPRTSNGAEMLGFLTFFMRQNTRSWFLQLIEQGKVPRARKLPSLIQKASTKDDGATAKVLEQFAKKGNLPVLEQKINILAAGKSLKSLKESGPKKNSVASNLFDGLNVNFVQSVEDVPTKARCIFVHNVDATVLLALLLKECSVLLVQPSEKVLIPAEYPSKRGVVSGKIFGQNGFNHFVVMGSRIVEIPDGEMSWSTVNSLVKLFYGSEGDSKTKTISDFTMYSVSADS